MHNVNPIVTIKLVEQRSISKLANKGDKMENKVYSIHKKTVKEEKRDKKTNNI